MTDRIGTQKIQSWIIEKPNSETIGITRTGTTTGIQGTITSGLITKKVAKVAGIIIRGDRLTKNGTMTGRKKDNSTECIPNQKKNGWKS